MSYVNSMGNISYMDHVPSLCELYELCNLFEYF